MNNFNNFYKSNKKMLITALVLTFLVTLLFLATGNPPGTMGLIFKKHYDLPPYIMYEGNLYRCFNPNGQKTIDEVIHTETSVKCESWQMPENNLESNGLDDGQTIYFVKTDITNIYTYNTLKESYFQWELIADKPVIAVTDHANNTQQIIVPMLKYADRLYTVSEFESGNSDYGTVDGGTVTRTIPLTETPQLNGTSNFLPEGTVLKVAEDGSFINCHNYSQHWLMKAIN